MMTEIIVFMIIVCLVLSIGIIGIMCVLLRTTRLYAAHKARLRLSEAELHEMTIGMAKEQELNTLLYELLLDFVSTKNLTTLQYKLADLSAILTTIEIRSGGAITVTGMKQTSNIITQLKRIMQTYNGLNTLEDTTKAAYTDFASMLTQLELDLSDAVKETDLATNAYAANTEYQLVTQSIRDAKNELVAHKTRERNKQERETQLIVSSMRAKKIFNDNNNNGIHIDAAMNCSNDAVQDEGSPDSC